MRYGREKAIGGPGVDAEMLRSGFFGVDDDAESFGCRNGDFSTLGAALSPGVSAGSGRSGIDAFADEVSIVMFLVFSTPPSLIV